MIYNYIYKIINKIIYKIKYNCIYKIIYIYQRTLINNTRDLHDYCFQVF